MLPSSPYEVHLPAARPDRGPLALIASVALHAVVVVALAGVTRVEIPAAESEAEARQPAMQFVELPPYAEPEAAPPPRPPENERRVEADPRVEPRRRIPRPQVARGAPMPEELAVREEPPPPDPDLPPTGAAPEPPATDPAPSAPSPAELAALRESEMRSEATRLFGPRRPGSDRAPGPITAGWVNEIRDNRDNDCTPTPRAPREPGAPVELGSVSGRVFRAGTDQPLPGAFLQILGTAYSTFADDDGDYTLEFDRALVDDCRTQYVQVSKDGFAPQRLILSLGPKSSNDIPLRRR
ncbi:MAG TPA: carboxypeptidase-like regulatory domain-containing protein [Gemmatimonadales bacterium]